VIEGQRPGGEQAVEMKMVLESLIPGMEHGDDTQGSTEPPSAKFNEGLTDSFKQEP